MLEGACVRLEPLSLDHARDLFEAGADAAVWRYLSIPGFANIDATRAWIEDAMSQAAQGREVPFAIVEKRSGRAMGSTRYMDIRRAHRGLEIGWTWLSPAVQRSAVNTECKYLLLSHAFDTLGALRVQLKTDHRNLKSQQAIERIGGVREGVLRHHMICPDGTMRDSVYFSILRTEWGKVKTGLETMVHRS